MTDFIVLIIEDDVTDAHLIKRVISEIRADVKPLLVGDGLAALSYLADHSSPDDPQRPSLILIDLHLPTLDGFEVLEAIKGDESLDDVPRVVLSSSSHSADVQKAYAKGCSSYLTKPMTLEGYRRMLEDLMQGWLIPRKP